MAIIHRILQTTRGSKIKSLAVTRGEGSIRFTDFTHFVYIYGYFAYVISVWCVYRNQHDCLNYYKMYNNIDRTLAVTYVRLTRKLIVKYFYVYITLYIFTSFFDYISWSFADWLLSTLYCADYVYALYNLLSFIDFLAQVILVEFRLKLINNFLLIYYAKSNPRFGVAGVMKDSGWTIDLVEIKINKHLNNLRNLDFNECIDFSSFTKCYLMLLEQIIYVNNAYGIRVRNI